MVPGVTVLGQPAGLEFLRLNVPLVRTHRSARNSEAVRDSTLVLWSDPGGGVAVAECAALSEPGYVTETAQEAWLSLTEVLGPALVGGEVDPSFLIPPIDGERGKSQFRDVAGANGGPYEVGPAALAALSDAALGCWLRQRGESLTSHLQESFARPAAGSVRWTAVVSAIGSDGGPRDWDDLESEVEADLISGASMVKLKVNPESDIAAAAERVRAVSRRVLGAEVGVGADANRSLPPERAREIQRARLLYVEEPFAAELGPAELGRLRLEMATPVALDESIPDIAALELALRAEAIDLVSVKPARLGGIRRAVQLALAAEAAGIAWFVGGMYELGVGRATALCLAAFCGEPTDLGPNSRYTERDICAPLRSDADGRLLVPEEVPLGAGALALEEPWVVERVELRR